MAQLTLFAPLADDPITMTTALAPAPLPLGVQLRSASGADAEEIGRLYFDSYPAGVVGQDVAEATADVEKALGGGYGELLPGGCQVALDEQSRLVACALAVVSPAWEDAGDHPFVIDVFTAPPWRGRGVARALMIAVMRAAALHGDRVGLRVEDDNHSAVSLYRHLGFSEDEAGADNAPTAAAAATAAALAQSTRPLAASEIASAAGGQGELDPALLAAVDRSAGAEPAGAESAGAEPAGAEPAGAEPSVTAPVVDQPGEDQRGESVAGEPRQDEPTS